MDFGGKCRGGPLWPPFVRLLNQRVATEGHPYINGRVP